MTGCVYLVWAFESCILITAIQQNLRNYAINILAPKVENKKKDSEGMKKERERKPENIDKKREKEGETENQLFVGDIV